MARSKNPLQNPRNGGGVVWVNNTLHIGLEKFSPELNAKVAVLIDRQADVGTRYMKQHARWTDRSGNARATLKVDPEHKGIEHKLVLHGGMPYQIYLELLHSGRYAIIGPTVPILGRQTMALLNGLLGMMK
jgi:hypothetical protein